MRALAAEHSVPVWTLGTIGGDLLEIAPVLGLPVASLVEAHGHGLARALGEAELGMCGVCGIWSPREQATADPAEAARLMFFSLYALQHRGQESAGIAATDGRDLRVVRRMGLVGQVFSEPDLGVLTGRAAMGHTRYSTTGSSKIQNAQPFTVRAEGLGELAIGHNGNCINAREIRDALARGRRALRHFVRHRGRGARRS